MCCFRGSLALRSFPTRRSSDLFTRRRASKKARSGVNSTPRALRCSASSSGNVCGTVALVTRSEEHTSELQSLRHLVCRLLLEKKKQRRGTACAVSDDSLQRAFG